MGGNPLQLAATVGRPKVGAHSRAEQRVGRGYPTPCAVAKWRVILRILRNPNVYDPVVLGSWFKIAGARGFAFPSRARPGRMRPVAGLLES